MYRYRRTTEQAHGGDYSLRVDYRKTGPFQFIGAEIKAGTNRRDFTRYNSVVVWVYGVADILLKLEDSSSIARDVSSQLATNPNGWTMLVYSYSHLAGQLNLRDVKNLMLFIEPGTSDASGTIYLDDIQIATTR